MRTKRTKSWTKRKGKSKTTAAQDIAALLESRRQGVSLEEDTGSDEEAEGLGRIAELDEEDLGMGEGSVPMARSQLRAAAGMDFSGLDEAYGGRVRRQGESTSSSSKDWAGTEESDDVLEGDDDDDADEDYDDGSSDQEEVNEREDLRELKRLAAEDRRRLEEDFKRIQEEQSRKAFQLTSHAESSQQQDPQHVQNQKVGEMP